MRSQAMQEVARHLRSEILKSSFGEAIRLYQETNDNEGFLVALFPSPPRKPIVSFVRFEPQEMDEVICWAAKGL